MRALLEITATMTEEKRKEEMAKLIIAKFLVDKRRGRVWVPPDSN